MSDNLQPVLERLRAEYARWPRPMLAQIATVHRVSVRKFAEIFEISKSHAEEILNHKTMPSLEVAIRIARYWECSVEELFGWRVDDDGCRRPLVVDIEKKRTRLKKGNRDHETIAVTKLVTEER